MKQFNFSDWKSLGPHQLINPPSIQHNIEKSQHRGHMSSYVILFSIQNEGSSWIIICVFFHFDTRKFTAPSGRLLTTDVRCPLGLKPHPVEPNPGKVTGMPKRSRIDYQLTNHHFSETFAVKLQGVYTFISSFKKYQVCNQKHLIKFQEKKHLPLQTYERNPPEIWRMFFFEKKTNTSKTTKTFPFVDFSQNAPRVGHGPISNSHNGSLSSTWLFSKNSLVF